MNTLHKGDDDDDDDNNNNNNVLWIMFRRNLLNPSSGYSEESMRRTKKCWRHKVEERNSGWSSRPMGLSLTCTMGGGTGGTDKNDKEKEVIKGLFVCTRDERM